MICKVCGYESNENFSVCTYCVNEISSQNQTSFVNQNNQYNQNNSSQYQTPFTRPNPQSNQYNQGNQYNNYNSEPTNNYSQNQFDRPVARHYKTYGSNMPDYFREGWKCSFEIDQSEIRMERFLNGGDFVGWTLIVMILLFILFPIFIFPIFFLLIFIFIPAKIKVNSNGITIKTIFKQYFLPKEKIDSIICRTVTRSKGRYGSESFYDVFIVMKDKSVANKQNLDTGLCYKNKIHVDYLIDMFNERLGFL